MMAGILSQSVSQTPLQTIKKHEDLILPDQQRIASFDSSMAWRNDK